MVCSAEPSALKALIASTGTFSVLFAATMFYLFGKRKVPNNALISSVLIAMFILALGVRNKLTFKHTKR